MDYRKETLSGRIGAAIPIPPSVNSSSLNTPPPRPNIVSATQSSAPSVPQTAIAADTQQQLPTLIDPNVDPLTTKDKRSADFVTAANESTPFTGFERRGSWDSIFNSKRLAVRAQAQNTADVQKFGAETNRVDLAERAKTTAGQRASEAEDRASRESIAGNQQAAQTQQAGVEAAYRDRSLKQAATDNAADRASREAIAVAGADTRDAVTFDWNL